MDRKRRLAVSNTRSAGLDSSSGSDCSNENKLEISCKSFLTGVEPTVRGAVYGRIEPGHQNRCQEPLREIPRVSHTESEHSKSDRSDKRGSHHREEDREVASEESVRIGEGDGDAEKENNHELGHHAGHGRLEHDHYNHCDLNGLSESSDSQCRCACKRRPKRGREHRGMRPPGLGSDLMLQRYVVIDDRKQNRRRRNYQAETPL